MLIVLLGLGTWQIQRLYWKQAILSRILEAEAAPPTPLKSNPEPYTKVSVTGHFRFDQIAKFGSEVRDTRAGPTMGFYQIVPLERDGAQPLLINRGWVPEKLETSLQEPVGLVTVIGYIRPSEVSRWFSPADDEVAQQFFTLNPGAIGNVIGVQNAAPFVLVALGPSVMGSYPTPAQHLPRPPNNHLSYVVTWYSLAVALVVIFTIWLRKALHS